MAFFYIPSDSPHFSQSCFQITYSPLLYIPLFSLAVVLVCFIFNEGIIIALSAQGPIFKKTRTFRQRQKYMPYLIYLRIVMAVLELLAIIASLVAVFHPLSTSFTYECIPLRPRLKFARAVVLLQVVSYVLFLVKVCIYTDPLGCFTPGLLERLTLLDDTDARGSLLVAPAEQSAEYAQQVAMKKRVSVDENSAAAEVNVWRKRNNIFNIKSDDIEKVTQVHNNTITLTKIERKLRALLCCLGVKGQRSRGVALEDLARGLYTVFSETDMVLSDVIAGFSLLREHQQKKRGDGDDTELIRKFRMVS